MNQYIYIFVFVAFFTYFITASPLKNEEWEQFCIIMKKKSPSHLSTIRVVFVMLSFFFKILHIVCYEMKITTSNEFLIRFSVKSYSV